jgi:ribosomal protein L18E
MYIFAEEIRLNDQVFLKEDDLKNRINGFKEIYDEINLNKITTHSSQVNGNTCIVKGSYLAEGKVENVTTKWAGKWSVEFGLHQATSHWYIDQVRIRGLTF